MKYITAILILFASSCTVSNNEKSGRVILNSCRYYDDSAKSVIESDYTTYDTLFYKGDKSIQELASLRFKDTLNTTIRIIEKKYLYCDLSTMSFYLYKSFHPDSNFISSFKSSDTTKRRDYWAFYYKNKKSHFENINQIADTVIKGIQYKRFIGSAAIEIYNNAKVDFRIFARTDKNNSGFHSDRKFDETHNCTIVRIEDKVASDTGHFWRLTENVFDDRPLTDFQLKVFAAWEKNAREHPVK